MIIDKFIISPKQPSRTDIAWAKPVKGGFALYLYYNGGWQPQVLMDGKATLTPEDDVIADISNIPEIVKETVGDTIETEVAKQIDEHDASVSDTHNTTTTDADDYPEVTIY